nr:ParA family protein [Mitsuaria sp. TWR114]
MPVILVANPKGGVGKSTLASNLAGFLAHRGHAVMLGDIDRQQSSARWLAQRPAALPAIRGWELASAEQLRTPKGVSHAVLDTPAGLHGKKLAQALKVADRVLVPLQPSLFDIQATYDFVRELQDAARDRDGPAGRPTSPWWRCGCARGRCRSSNCISSSSSSGCRCWPSCATPRTTCSWPPAA